jgi:hypothetical protein
MIEKEQPMTEQEWLACEEPESMLEFLQEKASDRKLRLFACACCRRMWSLLDDDRKRMLKNNHGRMAVEIAKKEAERNRKAVELAEKYADGQADFGELKTIYPSADDKEDADSHAAGSDAAWTVKASAYHARFLAMYNSPSSYPPGAEFRSPSKLEHDREQAVQGDLLRDLFGSPFRPVTLDRTWLTPKVVNLAQAIYDEKAFDRMALLGDALEQAGCKNAELLAHCRGPGPHVRGCWVVDLILGKE